jgi:hypothetical protein
MKVKKKYGNFMQDSVMANTANNCMNVLAEIFGERVLSQGLWHTCSPSLNPYEFYLLRHAKR